MVIDGLAGCWSLGNQEGTDDEHPSGAEVQVVIAEIMYAQKPYVLSQAHDSLEVWGRPGL